MKKRIRLIIDIAMTLALPLLMAYSLIGEMFHEITGTLIFALFIVHHVLNRKWAGSIRKGRYDAARIFRTVLNALLFIFMILQPLSGILMSKHLFTFLPDIPGSASARSIHLILAYWGYLLLSMHAGTHLAVPLSDLKRHGKGVRAAVYALLAAVSVYGIAAFVKRGFFGYITGRTMFAFFDYSEPVILFILDYLAVMALFMMIGYLAVAKAGRGG